MFYNEKMHQTTKSQHFSCSPLAFHRWSPTFMVFIGSAMIR